MTRRITVLIASLALALAVTSVATAKDGGGPCRPASPVPRRCPGRETPTRPAKRTFG